MSEVKTDFLTVRQCLPLAAKVILSQQRIREWYEYWKGEVYVSFSGGKDSTVLLHLVRSLYPKVAAVFIDTGLEYPEVRDFVKTIENVIWLKPKMPFSEVIKKYGYPVVSKETAQKIYEVRTTHSSKLKEKRLHGGSNGNGKLPIKWQFLIDTDFLISDRCCAIMKKSPAHTYEKESGKVPFVGTMAADSRLRLMAYQKTGCNAFEGNRPRSTPLGFWTEQDVWEYLRGGSVPYSKIYDMGYSRTGCMFCMFGVHLEKDENRFQRMAHTHPRQWAYCIQHLGCGKVLDILGVKYEQTATPENDSQGLLF